MAISALSFKKIVIQNGAVGMTLIARFKHNGKPIMIGDTLITSCEPERFELPSGHKVGKGDSQLGRYYVSGLRQKINILNDYVVVSWSGSFCQAKSVARRLLDITSDGNFSNQYIIDYVNCHLEEYDDLALLGIIIRPNPNDPVGCYVSYFSMNIEPSLSNVFDELYVAGSGKDDFLSILRNNYALPYSVVSLDKDMQCDALSFALTSMLAGGEFIYGHNLLRQWGGGFEALRFTEGKLEKLGNTCITFFLVHRQKGSFYLQFIPMVVYNYYCYDVLVSKVLEIRLSAKSFQFKLVKDKTYFILPIHKEESDYNLKKFTLDTYFFTSLCSYVFFSDYSDDVLIHLEHDYSGVSLFSFDVSGSNVHFYVSEVLIERLKEKIQSRIGGQVSFSGFSVRDSV